MDAASDVRFAGIVLWPRREFGTPGKQKLACAILLSLLSFSAEGATNEWTKPTSGYWEESYWSLGRLPMQQDAVAFRNPNWKALAIGANTTANYPGSLSVNNLLIQAPTYSFNQLLLNWAGLTVPLAVRSNLIIGVNGSLASHHSSLRAAYFEVNGPTTFSDGAVASFNQIVVGHVAAAELALENGSISCGRFVLGFGAPGTYRQTGGTLNTTNIEIGGSASFNLAGGAVSNAGLFTIRGPSSVLVAAATSQRLGKLQITNAPASASLDLQPGTNNAGAALLRFQDSRDIGWSGTLRILNFSTNHPGYGADHIFVGTNSQGLTSGQLSRVTFVRPNSSPSNYSAAITPIGEVVPAAAQGQDFRYITNNGTITITGYTGPGGDVIIPSTITGLPVTSIGVEAFEDSPNLTSVTLPNSVTNIGIFAFADCTSLTSVTIPNSVTTIGYGAFIACTSLTNAVIGNSVTNIGIYAFSYCASLMTITVNPDNSFYSSVGGVLFNKSQTTLISYPGGKAGTYAIPNTVTAIGAHAFESCISLGSVTIPDSVTTIGDLAFSYCPRLTGVIIGNSVTNVPYRAFSGCGRLTSVTIPNSVTTLGFEAFSYCTTLTNVIIGSGVTDIGGDAFYYCTSLISVSMGNSVTAIGSDAFYYCSSLIGITIPNSVTTVGAEAFFECTSMTSVTIGNGVTTIGNDAFSYCASLTSVTIPGNVVSFGNSAFEFCTSLTNAVIGNGVTGIGDYAFYGCTSLIRVTIPPSVTTIGDSAFDYCISLTGVTIPNSVTSIGSWAFDRCTNLTSVAIPNSVTSIGPYAFFGCTSLTNVTIPKSVTAIGVAAFSACRGLSAITVAPDNSFYSSLDGVLFNKSRTTLISCPGAKAGTYTIPNSVTSIGDAAFFDCASLTSVTMANSVTSIGSEAFSDCAGLLGITLPNSILAIADAAFSGCSNLTSVTIPNSVTSIGYTTFWECTGFNYNVRISIVNNIERAAFFGTFNLIAITVDPNNSFFSSLNGVLFDKAQTSLVLYPPGKGGSYTIPNSVSGIGDWAFYNCTSLTDITLPNNLTNIGYGAFSYCTNLAGLTIPNSVNTIGVQAFESCAGLTSVTIPNSVTTLGDFAFQNCTGLTTVIIGDGVTSIHGAFAGCIRLIEVTLPNSITTIGNEAFSDCTSLTSIAIPNSVTTIGVGAFFDCARLTNVTIPNSVTGIEDRAFGFCTNLTAVYFAGNAPNVAEADVFDYAWPTIYYLPGTTGWGPTFADRPTALWLPKVDTNPATFGVHSDRFGFIISWAGARTVIVEARTNLAKGVWIPLSTNTLTDGSFYFSDPQWTNYPSRFYRLLAP